MRLSETAKYLLTIIAENTERDWSTLEIKRLWWAGSNEEWSNILHDRVIIGGGGQVRTLESMVNKGLIERPKSESLWKHRYALTEDGLQAFESIRSEMEAIGEKNKAEIRRMVEED